VIPLPSNLILTYEMLILFGVLATIAGLFICGRFFTKRSKLYSSNVSLDQVGVIVEMEERCLEPAKQLFNKHKALEIREEVVG